ncbi:MAG: type II toxin-antitoxin system RelE/ParE family toxin [Candidatus Omnitrophota bacterium]
MIYNIQFKPKAVKDLKNLPATNQSRIFEKIEELRINLNGDVKRLTNFSVEYRLRVGDYRALFDVVGQTIIIYRIRHRGEAYQ